MDRIFRIQMELLVCFELVDTSGNPFSSIIFEFHLSCLMLLPDPFSVLFSVTCSQPVVCLRFHVGSSLHFLSKLGAISAALRETLPYGNDFVNHTVTSFITPLFPVTVKHSYMSYIFFIRKPFFMQLPP